jgi:hypothetical protein
MATQNQALSYTVQAGADLSTFQYRLISVAGTLAAEGDTAIGSLQNKPLTGEPATVDTLGRTKLVAGAAITAGARLKVQSGGWVIVATSGSGIIGKEALNKAVVSGAIFDAYVNAISALTNFDGQ